jgi:hypothetical protein
MQLAKYYQGNNMLNPSFIDSDPALNELLRARRTLKPSLWRKRCKPLDKQGDELEPSFSITATREGLRIEIIKTQSNTL